MSRTNHNTPNWPKPHPTKGPALSRVQVEARLGLGYNVASVLLKRTRDGSPTNGIAFPEPEGFAVPYAGYRRPQLYWWELDVITYGRKAGKLDSMDRPLKEPR